MAKKIEELIANKERAEIEQNYDLLVSLRDAIEFMRDRAREYRQSLELKSIAIEQEDYEVAKRLKIKIEHQRKYIANGYGVDTKSGKIFQKSRDYKDIQVDPLGYETKKKQELLTQVSELAEAIN